MRNVLNPLFGLERLRLAAAVGAAAAMAALYLGACSLKDLSYLQAGLGGGDAGAPTSSATATGAAGGTPDGDAGDGGNPGDRLDAGDGGDAGDAGTVADAGDAGVVDLTKGLYLYYKFDETDGGVAADSSGNMRSGAVTGGTWAPGKIGGAVSLSGDQQFVALPAGILEPLNEVTVAFWINWGGGTLWQRVFDFGAGTTSWMYMSPNSYMTTLQGLRFAMLDGNVTEYATGTNVPMGTWVHVAVTLQKPNSWIYVDGQVQGTSDAMVIEPSDLGSTTQNWIGRSQFPTDPYLMGMVDEFRIYDRALSDAEVAALAKMGN
jgi:hypothetical protein